MTGIDELITIDKYCKWEEEARKLKVDCIRAIIDLSNKFDEPKQIDYWYSFNEHIHKEKLRLIEEIEIALENIKEMVIRKYEVFIKDKEK